MCHECVFLVDEVCLSALRLAMLTSAEIRPSPKVSQPSAIRLLVLLLQAGCGLGIAGRGSKVSGRFRSCGMSLQGRFYAVRGGLGLPDRGGRDDDLLEHMG